MANNGLSTVAYDSGSSATFLMGTTVVPVRKLTPPKVEVKTEKVRSSGQGIAKKRTIGVTEVSDGNAEIELGYYNDLIMPRLPQHGGTLIEFVGTLTIRHPSITGSYGQLYDHCRIISIEGPEITDDEKALVMKLGFSCMNIFQKGSDGKYKCLNFDEALPSSQAKAAMSF